MTMVLSSLLVGAASTSVLCVLIAHGILKPLLQSRGIKSWSFADTLGSTVLLTAGSALVGAATTLVALIVGGLDADGTRVATAATLTVIGAAMARFGLLSLRKLS